MHKIAVSRRTIVKTLLALGAGGVFSSYLPAFAADDQPMNVESGLKSPLEVFREVSQLVTLHDDLDPGALEKMHAVFQDEPWAPDHIRRLYRKMTAAIEHGASKNPRPMPNDPVWQFDKGESWFAEHLLTTWYLGIYYHNERPTQRITYEHALMFRSLKGVIPIPYIEPVGYGNWAHPPEEKP